ncbi:hypothetical protein PULV_a1495 [Pseudoalteromonas ulvae UL12]|uniref:hypothetical protein n=1 Tax=Pseudoalteromonas ulvae TaxID=107327 RepID=UPI00186BA27A|nr:hypothetical protein [Pseudoalteromonas ulvae]MBE0363964.1 hypothetical protein [Pseudoalteromonas ulvae UL12]
MIEKDSILMIAGDLVNEICPEESIVFEGIKESLLEDILNDKDNSDIGNTGFGDFSEAISTVLTVFITAAAIQLAKEGIKLTKHSLKLWIKQNQNKIIVDERKKDGVLLQAIKNYLNEK